MPVTPLVPEGPAIWSSRLAVLVAALCAILALVTGVAETTFFFGARPLTLLLAGVGAMLYAIWVVVLQLYFYGLRQRGER